MMDATARMTDHDKLRKLAKVTLDSGFSWLRIPASEVPRIIALLDEIDRLTARAERAEAALAGAVGVVQRWVSWCDDWRAGKPHPSDDLDAARAFLAKHNGQADD